MIMRRFQRTVALVALVLALFGLGAGLHGAAARAETTTAASGCHPSYTKICIAIGKDVDCKDVGSRNFPAAPDDPYKLDADHDGVACETEDGVLVVGPGEGLPSASPSATKSATPRPTRASPTAGAPALAVTPGASSTMIIGVTLTGLGLLGLGVFGFLAARRRPTRFVA